MPILGDGVKIGYLTGSPPQYLNIPFLDELSAVPIPVADELANTTHGTNGYKTVGDGLLSVAPFTTTHYYDGENEAIDDVIAAAFARTPVEIRIEIPADELKTTFKAIQLTAKVSAAIAAPKDNWQRVTFTWRYAGDYDGAEFATPGASEIVDAVSPAL